MMLRLFLLAVLLLAHGEVLAETSAEKAGFPPRLIIYNAKGPANACGPGCDRWIAVEGQVDEGAAALAALVIVGSASAAQATEQRL